MFLKRQNLTILHKIIPHSRGQVFSSSRPLVPWLLRESSLGFPKVPTLVQALAPCPLLPHITASPAQVSLRSDSALPPQSAHWTSSSSKLASAPLLTLGLGDLLLPKYQGPHLCFSTWNIRSCSSLPHHPSTFFFPSHAVLLACEILVLQRD